VKNFVSNAVSLLRGLPFNQVQSQSENGTIFSFFAGAVVESLAACAKTGVGAGAAGDVAAIAGTVATAVVEGGRLAGAGGCVGGCINDERFLISASCALICSMRVFIVANSFSSSSVTTASGGGGAAGAGVVAVFSLAAVSGPTVEGSCIAAIFVGDADCADVCPEQRGARPSTRAATSNTGIAENTLALSDEFFMIFKRGIPSDPTEKRMVSVNE